MVARAAEALNVTQPAVSKQIADLERIIGVPLFKRDRNRLYLTAIGEQFANHARQMLDHLDRAVFDVEAMASGVSGSVSIGVVSSVAPTLLPQTIALFKRSAPKANISITDGHFVSLLPLLESGALDLLIARVWQPQTLPGIEQETLFSEPLVVVGGRDNPLAENVHLTWSDVASSPWIVPQSNSVARDAVDALFARNGLAPPDNTIASLSITLNLAVMKSMPALALFPRQLAQTHAARGEIVALPLDTQGFLSEARCFWRGDQLTANGTLSLFVKCLRQSTAGLNTIPVG